MDILEIGIMMGVIMRAFKMLWEPSNSFVSHFHLVGSGTSSQIKVAYSSYNILIGGMPKCLKLQPGIPMGSLGCCTWLLTQYCFTIPTFTGRNQLSMKIKACAI